MAFYGEQQHEVLEIFHDFAADLLTVQIVFAHFHLEIKIMKRNFMLCFCYDNLE